jgi:hypothetical protein
MGCSWTPLFSREVTPGTHPSWAGLLHVAALPTTVGTPVTCPPRWQGMAPAPAVTGL